MEIPQDRPGLPAPGAAEATALPAKAGQGIAWDDERPTALPLNRATAKERIQPVELPPNPQPTPARGMIVNPDGSIAPAPYPLENRQQKVLRWQREIAQQAERPAVQASTDPAENIRERLPVVSEEPITSNGLDVTQFGVQTGRPGEANQVSELQVASKPQSEAMNRTDALYAQQKDALARGDHAEADRLGEQLQAQHEAAASEFQPSRSGGEVALGGTRGSERGSPVTTASQSSGEPGHSTDSSVNGVGMMERESLRSGGADVGGNHILAAAEQSQRSGGKDTRVADALLDSGALTRSQSRELLMALHEAPIVFASGDLERDEDVWRVFEHSTDEERQQLASDPRTLRKIDITCARLLRGTVYAGQLRECQEKALLRAC